MHRLIKRVFTRQFLAVIGKGLFTKGFKAHTFEKTGWNNPIGVNVITTQHKSTAGYLANRALWESDGLSHHEQTAWNEMDSIELNAMRCQLS